MKVLYNLGARLNNELNASEVVKIHYLHASANENKVLFTTERMLVQGKMHLVTEIILTTKDGSVAMVGNVVAIGKYDENMTPPAGFSKPSLWNDEIEAGKMWFAIDDVHKIYNGIQRGQYICNSSDNDVLDSINSNADIVYYI